MLRAPAPSRTLALAERRSTLRLYKTWDTARAKRALPSLSEFDLSILEQMGGACFLLDCATGQGDPTFRYFGHDLAVEIGRDLTTCSISDAPRSSLLAHVVGNHRDVVAKAKAIGLSGTYFQSPGPHLLYRGILLPFSSDGTVVDAVLGHYRSRAARQQTRASASPTRDLPATVRPERSTAAIEGYGRAPAEPVVEFRAATKRARRSIGSAEIDERSTTSVAERLASAVSGAARETLWPRRALRITSTAPAIGKAVLWQDASAELVLLLARRVDAQAGRYEVVFATQPFLVNLAMRLAARTLARNGITSSVPSAAIAAARLRDGPLR